MKREKSIKTNKNRKRIGVCLVFLLAVSMFVIGCGKKEEKNSQDTPQEKEENQDSSETGKEEGNSEEKKDDTNEGDLDLSQYVTLGKYKGLEYSEPDLSISDEELQEAIDQYVKENSTKQVTDRKVENGDVINLDFTGYVDGEAFDGGTAAGYRLEIGSGAMIPGFEEGTIGMLPGETKNVDVTFPEEYRKEGMPGSELNGKPAVFEITVNYIEESVELEYNEEFVKTYTEFDTAEEFEEDLKAELVREKQEEAEENRMDELFSQLVENAEIHELPQSELDQYHDNLVESYQSMADSVEMELADFLQQYYGVTEDDLEEYASDYAELMATQAVLFQSIAQAEGISLSDEEYQEGLDEYYDMMGGAYDSREEFEEEISDLLKDALLYEKVEQFILENAVAAQE